MKARIIGLGKYAPEKILTNHDLEKLVETNDEWITSRTGIKERHIAAEDETTSVLAAKAADQAIKDAGISKDDIDMIIVATITPDMPFPATACLVQDILKIPNVATVDIEAACSGFIYGLSMANAYITCGMYKNVLVIASETLSKVTNWEDRSTCILFGDGSGAAVVSASEDDEHGFIDFKLGGDGSYKDLLYQPGGGSLNPASHETVDNKLHTIHMAGNSVFKVAVRTMAEVMEGLMKKHDVKPEDMKWLVPHQANYRIIEAVGNRLGLDNEKQVYVNLSKYGNTSAATIPIALQEAVEEGKIEKGDIIGLVAFGGGFTWGSALIKW